MNWILIANTAVSKIDYNGLVLSLVFIISLVLGFRLAGFRIKQRSRKKEIGS